MMQMSEKKMWQLYDNQLLSITFICKRLRSDKKSVKTSKNMVKIAEKVPRNVVIKLSGERIKNFAPTNAGLVTTINWTVSKTNYVRNVNNALRKTGNLTDL